MELWIRSQDRMKLCNAKVFSLDNDQTGIFCNSYEDRYVFAGKYKTKERALEVLDEISSKIKNQYIVEIKPLLSNKDIERIEFTLNNKYNENFIMQPPETTITPINSNVIYYEMPEE